MLAAVCGNCVLAVRLVAAKTIFKINAEVVSLQTVEHSHMWMHTSGLFQSIASLTKLRIYADFALKISGGETQACSVDRDINMS